MTKRTFSCTASILLITILWISEISAQVVSLDFGPTVSRMEWTSTMGYEITVFEDGYNGYYANLGISYLQKSFVELVTQVGFVNAGGKGTVLYTPPSGDSDTIGTKTSLDFINFSTGARLKIKVGEHIFPYINLGIGFDYLVNYNEEPGGLLIQFEEEDELSRMIYKALFGAGVYYDIKKWRMGILFDYNLAINKLVDFTSEWDVTNTIGVNYSKIGVSVGYKIN